MKIILPALVLFFQLQLPAQTPHIKVYFNQPADTTLSSGTNAIVLNHAIDDTLIAYIGRAKQTIDIAVYSYSQSSQITSIATALNAAYANGRRIRVIHDGAASSSGINLLNAAIPVVASPTTSNYNIMHNKFVVFDANSADANDAIVWTGSANWTAEQINYDDNNIVIVNDSSLAHAYLTEFNEMWGDSGLTPNSAASRFGPYKTDNTQHQFTIDGKQVECYFSPSDNTNDHILNVLRSADEGIYFGVYTFTDDYNADTIIDRMSHGVYVAGIMDQYSLPFNAYSELQPVMGNNLQIYSDPSYIYHSKHVIVDPCNPNSDPVVETGSHNWSLTADTKNDENILIIHDATIANIYLQEFKSRFEYLGGTLLPCSPSGIKEESNSMLRIYPDPASDFLHIDLNDVVYYSYQLIDFSGKIIKEEKNSFSKTIGIADLPDGIYIIKIAGSKNTFTKRFTKISK